MLLVTDCIIYIFFTNKKYVCNSLKVFSSIIEISINKKNTYIKTKAVLK